MTALTAASCRTTAAATVKAAKSSPSKFLTLNHAVFTEDSYRVIIERRRLFLSPRAPVAVHRRPGTSRHHALRVGLGAVAVALRHPLEPWQQAEAAGHHVALRLSRHGLLRYRGLESHRRC